MLNKKYVFVILVLIIAIVGQSYFYIQLQNNHDKLQQDYSQLTGSYETLNTSFTSLHLDYSQLTGNYETLDDSYSSLQNQYSSLQTQIDTFQNQISNLNEQVEIQYDLRYDAGYAQGVIDSIGRGYTLRDPTYSEVMSFVADNQIDKNPYVIGTYTCWNFAADFKSDTFEAGYRCGLVYLGFPDDAHTIICFDTVDMGVIYIEPQTDEFVSIIVGQPYWDRTIYSPPTYDDTIISFAIVW